MWHYVTTDSSGWTSTYSADQTDNAKEVWDTLVGVYGWAENSASAVLGNLQYESYLNPGQWEIGRDYSMSYGMGLGQWTPATKVSNYIGSANRDDMADGAKQLMLFINTPSQYNTHYLNPDGSSTYYNETGLPYITSMEDFSHSTASVSDLTKVWAICWERPGNTYYTNSINDRITHATHWYGTFTGSTPQPPTPPTPPTPQDAQAIFWMFLRKRKKKYY